MITAWRPTSPIPLLKARAQILRKIRHFLDSRHIVEVETPLLSASSATDPYLHSFETQYYGPSGQPLKTLYLQTSPEFAMKRLLAAGSGPIYQITRAFRNIGESGRWHNPEFTMLEWYRPCFNLEALMDEVEALLQVILNCPIAQRFSYAAIFQYYFKLDPHHVEIRQLKELANQYGITIINPETIQHCEDWLGRLLDHIVTEWIDDQIPLFIYDFPASQASLARIRPGYPPVAERVEVYLGGLELANGFHELTDANEQRERFLRDLSERKRQGLSSVPIDDRLLAALEQGLPDCSGIALGVDRLIALALKQKSVSDVMSFTIERA